MEVEASSIMLRTLHSGSRGSNDRTGRPIAFEANDLLACKFCKQSLWSFDAGQASQDARRRLP